MAKLPLVGIKQKYRFFNHVKRLSFMIIITGGVILFFCYFFMMIPPVPIKELYYILIFSGLIYLSLDMIDKYTKYIPCPYPDCDNSILIYYKWNCPKCKKNQSIDTLIIYPCEYCKRELETFYCEHCKREFKL